MTDVCSSRAREARGWKVAPCEHVEYLSCFDMAVTYVQRLTFSFMAYQSITITLTQWRQDEFKSGGTCLAPRTRKLLLLYPSQFLAQRVQLVVLVSAFAMVSRVWSVCFFAILLLPCPAICKSGGYMPSPQRKRTQTPDRKTHKNLKHLRSFKFCDSYLFITSKENHTQLQHHGK